MLIVTVKILKTSVAFSATTILGRTINQLVLANVFGHSAVLSGEGFNTLREFRKRRTVEVDMIIKPHLNHVGGKLLRCLLQSCGVLKRGETMRTTGDVGGMEDSRIEQRVVGMLRINNLIGFGEFQKIIGRQRIVVDRPRLEANQQTQKKQKANGSIHGSG